MSDLKIYHLYESGSIPGQEGIFPAGISITIDQDTNQIVNRQPILAPSDLQESQPDDQVGSTQPLPIGGSN